MGIPLSRIPDIREFYGREPYGDSPIIFEEETPVPPIGHVIAARITGENASDGFKPTNGRIELVIFIYFFFHNLVFIFSDSFFFFINYLFVEYSLLFL